MAVVNIFCYLLSSWLPCCRSFVLDVSTFILVSSSEVVLFQNDRWPGKQPARRHKDSIHARTSKLPHTCDPLLHTLNLSQETLLLIYLDAGEPVAAKLQRHGGSWAGPQHLREQERSRRGHEVLGINARTLWCHLPRGRHPWARLRCKSSLSGEISGFS